MTRMKRTNSRRGLMGQGKRANDSGKMAEAIIDAILRYKRYWPERQHYIGKGIYGGDLKADFFVADIPHFPEGLIIESKWQELPGSIDEKFAYLATNIRQCYPCPTIIIADGGGARPGAITWLRQQIDMVRLYDVLSITEFVTWSSHNL